SAQTSLLARASGYAICGEGAGEPVAAGAPVRVNLFSCGGAPVEVA
ncbi:MAG: hypothetical protein IAI49_02055, partial [Candidatus Eremiobacteraeota bacterium]|nr:hypothetical protein [Candidatus Eremiobacteraeota bacterium]